MARGRRYGRRFLRRARGVKLSIVSKAALTMAGVIPVLIPGSIALSRVISPMTVSGKEVSMLSKLAVAGATFSNEFVQGFGLSAPFGTVPVVLDDGTIANFGITSATPKGSFLALTGVATGVVIADVVRSWLLNASAGRRGRAAKGYGGLTVTSGK